MYNGNHLPNKQVNTQVFYPNGSWQIWRKPPNAKILQIICIGGGGGGGGGATRAAGVTAGGGGVTDAESTVLHAVTREEIGRHADDWATLQSMRAACGTAVKLLSIDGEAPTSWPMPTKYAPTMSRCPECRRVCGGRINRHPCNR